jgi:hypothetical protein
LLTTCSRRKKGRWSLQVCLNDGGAEIKNSLPLASSHDGSMKTGVFFFSEAFGCVGRFDLINQPAPK